jgi:hypothetical protein
MAYVPTANGLHNLTSTKAPVAKRVSLFSMLIAAMAESRRRQAEREIARYFRNAGGKFTDEAERDIERVFLSKGAMW